MQEIIVVKNNRMHEVYSIGVLDWDKKMIYPLDKEQRHIAESVRTDNKWFYMPECKSGQYLSGAVLKFDNCIYDIDKGIGIIPQENFEPVTLAIFLSFFSAKQSGHGSAKIQKKSQEC